MSFVISKEKAFSQAKNLAAKLSADLDLIVLVKENPETPSRPTVWADWYTLCLDTSEGRSSDF